MKTSKNYNKQIEKYCRANESMEEKWEKKGRRLKNNGRKSEEAFQGKQMYAKRKMRNEMII